MSSKYEERKKRIRAKEKAVEEIILDELDAGALMARDILPVVRRKMKGDIHDRSVMRAIYKIMYVDENIPKKIQDDLIIL